MQALHNVLLFQVLICLGQNGLGSDIIKGKKAKKKSMLYMASVQSKNGHICGGFLVSEDFVMTAAHCDTWKPVSVILGTHNLKEAKNGMRYDIKKCKHPLYRSVESGNDIMLLKLSRKANLGKKGPIKPVQLPSEKIQLKAGQTCSVAGWGATKTKGTVVDELQVVDVPIIDLKTCQQKWKNKLPVNVTCAGGYNTKRGFCQGDSGGPLVNNKNVAVGVVSFNSDSNCDYPNLPNVYTDISKFLPWINKILKKKQC